MLDARGLTAVIFTFHPPMLVIALVLAALVAGAVWLVRSGARRRHLVALGVFALVVGAAYGGLTFLVGGTALDVEVVSVGGEP